MFLFLFILLSIVNGGEKFKKMSQSMDILSTIVINFETEQLIQMIYDPLTVKSHAAITQELRERIRIGKTNFFDLLLAMHRQRKKGKRPRLEDEISENVRISLQKKVDESCVGWICDLSADETDNSANTLNELLEALAYFDKEIIVPSHVRVLDLSNLRLTSLWLRFRDDSFIEQLVLTNNDFEELNNETFGQYIHEKSRRRIRVLSLYGCKSITQIDFDELALPNLTFVGASNCAALAEMKNIPWTIKDLYLRNTNIRGKAQLKFKKQTGNSLQRICCDSRDQNSQLIADEHLKNSIQNAMDEGSAPEAGCQCVIS